MSMVAVLVGLLLAQAPSEEGWKNLWHDGVTLDTRPVPGSAFFEYRAQTDSDLKVETLCHEIYEWASISTDHDNITARKVLEDHGDMRVVYDQLSPPLVAQRDFAFTVRRARKGASSCRIDLMVTNDKAPPLPQGFVRIEKLSSSWLFERTENGTHVTYTLFSDPGGSMPPALVHNAQRDATVKTLQLGLQHARGDRG